MEIEHATIIQMYKHLCERAKEYELEICVPSSNYINIINPKNGYTLTRVKTVQEGHLYLNGWADAMMKKAKEKTNASENC